MLIILLLVFVGVVAVDWWLASRGGEPAARELSEWPGVAPPSLTTAPGPLEEAPYNLLALGLGNGSQGGRPTGAACQSVTVVHVDERLKRMALLSIPTATYVDIQGYGKRTLAEAYGLGGVDLVEAVVEDITGMEMRNHLALGPEAFAGLVDLLGGVEFNLQEEVSDPRWGRLEAGPVLLDGIGALLVTESSSYPGGELDRIRARQAFAITAANQVHDCRFAAGPGLADQPGHGVAPDRPHHRRRRPAGAGVRVLAGGGRQRGRGAREQREHRQQAGVPARPGEDGRGGAQHRSQRHRAVMLRGGT